MKNFFQIAFFYLIFIPFAYILKWAIDKGLIETVEEPWDDEF